MSVKDKVKQLLTERENRHYEKLLQDRKVSYENWAVALEGDWNNWETGCGAGEDSQVSIGEAGQDRQVSADEVEQDSSEYIVIQSSEGRFAQEFCAYVRRYFAAHPESFILYGDEDVGNERQDGQSIKISERRLPWFKPDWSPDLFESCFYFGSVVVLRKELFHRMEEQFTSMAQRDTHIRADRNMTFYMVTDFVPYEIWMHQLVELAGAYGPGSHVVGHVTMPWFTVTRPEDRDKYLEKSLFLRKRQEILLQNFRNQSNCQNYPVSGKVPMVSVVILSKNHPEVLKTCLKGCEDGAKGQNETKVSYEVILVDNGSSDKNRKQVEALIQEWEELSGCRITYLYRPQDFNFSRLCNLGAEQAAGKLLFFLNDDVVLCRPGCMEMLAALANRPWTGAVGIKLYYPDSVRIQHMGITNLPMGPVHKLQFLEDDKCYYYGANRGRHNRLAVTAACLMVSKEKYLEAGGFAEELPVAFNDVDLCFRLYELGYQNVCMNDMEAYHHESLSRGDDETPEKLLRLLGERDKLYERHPALAGVDPYYSPHLNQEGLDVAIRPAYLTAGNAVQRVEVCQRVFSLKGYRRDLCLMVRVEDCRDRKAVGYGVVLGDNNACYEKILLMEQTDDSIQSSETKIYAIKLVGQYRPDLEENMPDQVNVGMSGFMIYMTEGVVPKGRYRLGMGVRNRITGLRLVNWSNRVLEL